MKHIYKLFSILIILAMLLGPLSALAGQNAMASEDPNRDVGVPIPPDLGFFVRPDLDSIHAYNWQLNATVTVEIDDPATPDQPDYVVEGVVTDDSAGYSALNFDLSGIFDIQPGFLISLTDGETVLYHSVSNLAILSVDHEIDMVYGTADAGAEVTIEAPAYSAEQGIIRVEHADDNGDWAADFATMGDEIEPYDIVPGDYLAAFQKEQDGWTYISFYVAEEDDGEETVILPTLPHVEAWVNQGSVEGHKWDLGTEVTLQINGEAVGTKMVGTADWDPNLTFVAFEYDLLAGDQIMMSGLTDDNDPIIKVLTLTGLEITGVDPETELVAGLAEPGTQVEIWVCWEDGCTENQVQVAGNDGIWNADFSDEQSAYDIVDGMQVNAAQWDDDGDYTLFAWTVFTPEPPDVPGPPEPPVEETEDPPGEIGEVEYLDDIPDFLRGEIGGDAWYGNFGPALLITPLLADQHIDAGMVSVFNTRGTLQIVTETSGEWLITETHIYVGTDPILTKKGNPIPGKFPYKKEFTHPTDHFMQVVHLVDDMGFYWGEPWENERIQNIAVHVDLVQLDDAGEIIAEEGAWAYGTHAWEGTQWGWWFEYEMGHPKRGHFIDSPVSGLSFRTPTHVGVTDISGGFDFFPGERIELSVGSVILGTPEAGHKISPLDIYENADTDDPRVINMARLLQSLDADASPKDGIEITAAGAACLDSALEELGITDVVFGSDSQMELIITTTINYCPDLVAVSAEDAKANLDEALSSTMFRKNISRTPSLTSSKSKLNIMGVWFPALRANDEPTVIEYFDEDGALIRTAEEAKPLIVVYTDGVEPNDYEDIFAAISRDDGNTFKRVNIARGADRTSFTLATGEDYYGQTKKPVFQVKGNNIMVAWTSKFCNGGKPAYAIDPEDDYTYDDPYYTEDIWGVGGPQRSVDYTLQGFPEVGEVPYSCVWVARGTILNQTMINSGNYGLAENLIVGEIVWYKPERLTSGRRDANQVFMGASDGAGFAIAWQEDPAGLRPGDAAGPGPGWGGATTNHKTDIWYSYITVENFRTIDANFVPGSDPLHEIEGRPKALVPMSLPVRLSDNDAVNTDNLMLNDGSSTAEDISYLAENLTRCVKFEGGETIVEKDSPDIATYHALNPLPADHSVSMNCTNCHIPADLPDTAEGWVTQGAPIPLVVLDAANHDFLGGFTNADCTSCHYGNVVPRDRLIAVTPGLDELVKAAECADKGGTWDLETEAYYPYEGYPYFTAEQIDVEDQGTHDYALVIEGLCVDYYEFTNYSDALKQVCITEDGRLLDGDTGASRPNLFLQTYKKPDGTMSAWAIMAYEESKGAGVGPPDHTEDPPYGDAPLPEEGKVAVYHSFDFQNPDKVSAGNIINLPERDADGNIMYLRDVSLDGDGNLVYGALILDYLGQPQLAYENARRPRFILQGKAAAGASKTVLLVLYKEGLEGHGRPSDILLRRVVFSPDRPNPYDPANFVCDDWVTADNGLNVCMDGTQNMSAITPTVVTDSQGEPTSDDPYGAVKVVQWVQTEENLDDSTWVVPYDDARAHRGAIRGDVVLMGFSYTPNWAAARNGNDKYDFYVRRSFDGGQTWTTDPAGSGVTTCDWFTDPLTKIKTEVCTTYGPGDFEQAHNLSQLPNSKTSVIEPRIVGAPGTIKVDGVWTGKDEDLQNKNVFYVSYGTATNPPIVHGDEIQEYAAPLDLYYSFTIDRGESYVEVAWDVNPDSDGNFPGETVYRWDFLAKGEGEQGEAQLRMTPDGSRFYATWLGDSEEGSDIWFRRIMPPIFLLEIVE